MPFHHVAIANGTSSAMNTQAQPRPGSRSSGFDRGLGTGTNVPSPRSATTDANTNARSDVAARICSDPSAPRPSGQRAVASRSAGRTAAETPRAHNVDRPLVEPNARRAANAVATQHNTNTASNKTP